MLPERAAEILLASVHDDNANVRYWAVEGLAYLGSNESINGLLDVLHDDPSLDSRTGRLRPGAIGHAEPAAASQRNSQVVG